MGISKVTKICENNQKRPRGSCSLSGSQSLFLNGMLPVRKAPATPVQHVCPDHRRPGTRPSFLHHAAASETPHTLLGFDGQNHFRARSCCITDATSCCRCFSCGIPHQSPAQAHCWPVLRGEAISATLEATHENRLFLMQHQVQVLLSFLIMSEKYTVLKEASPL